MSNYKLLEKYRKKMSIYFTMFVLLSIWLIIGFFEVSQYINQNIKEEKILNKKYAQINNVIQNRNIYNKSKEITLTKVINKILENSLIMLDGKALIHTIDGIINTKEFKTNTFINKSGYKYLQKNIKNEEKTYNILIRTKQKETIDDLKSNFLYLLLISIPFSILFYIIGYFFVGKNLKPIRENIINLQDFIGNINHEFKTPLSEVLSSLELAEKTGKYKEAVEQSIKSSKKINNILNSLIGIMNSNTYSYKKEKVNIVLFLKDIIKSYKNKTEEKNINIFFETNTKQYYLNLDKQHLHICFSNILSNAIKYSDEKSDIIININENIIKVTDNGQGIDKKNLDKIFNRYFRESYNKDGTGIGLSLVKKICDTNKWDIRIESKKNVGTTVTLKI